METAAGLPQHAADAMAVAKLPLAGGDGSSRAEKRKALQLPSVESRISKLPACAYKVFPASFRRLRQPGDGSCFFASWANAVFGNNYDATPDRNRVAHNVRDMVADMMTEQVYERTAKRILRAASKHHAAGKAPPPPDIPSFAEFKRKMRTYNVWADLVMITVVALRLHHNIYFFDDKLCGFFYGTDRNNAAQRNRRMPWVFILWTGNHSHFDLIVRENSDGTLSHNFTLEKDGPLLSKIRNFYELTAGTHASPNN